jgi:hypothetical protein
VLFFFAVVGMCEFIFAARGWLIHGFDQTLDGELLDRYVEHVVELILVGIDGAARPAPGSKPSGSVNTGRQHG